MPRVTVQYEYEWIIYGGCQEFARRLLGGDDIGCGFTALIDANGYVIYFQSNELKEDIREELKRNYGVIFFDPFDGPVHTFISWNNCSRKMLERSLNISLESAGNDFFSDSKQVMY